MMAYQESFNDLLLQLSEHCLSLSFPLYGKDRIRNVSEMQITKKKKQTVQKFKKIAYSALLNFSNQNPCSRCSLNDGFTEIHSLLAIIYDMRVSRKFDDANNLETHLNKLKGANNKISDDVRNSLRFLMCLHGTGKVESPSLGQLRPLPKLILEKDDCRILPAGAMFYGDTTSLNDSGFFTVYPREIFEQAIPLSVTPPTSQQVALFETCPGYDLNGNELFTPINHHADKEEKDDSQFLLGALFHKPRVRGKSLLGVKLEIPEISSSSLRPMDFILSTTSNSRTNSSIKKAMFSTLSEDEGFIESDSPLSAKTSGADTEDIWDAAMKIKPRTCFNWETIGCYSLEKDKPYLTEADPIVVERIYETQQHELLLMDSSFHFTIPISITPCDLIKDIINLLIGIPSETFSFVKCKQVFELRHGVHTPGVTPESLEKLLSEFVETGSFYHKLEQLSSKSLKRSVYAEGLIMQAFKGGISQYLQSYRAYVLSLADQNRDATVLKLHQVFRGLCQQIRFLAELCKFSLYECDSVFDEKLPKGVELLTYIYQTALEQWGLQNYLVSIFLLKCATAPYLHFLREWLFEGVCNDFYDEFHVQKNFAYLTAEDETYWTKCYVQTTQELSKCVPQFLSDIASDILVCGKSINLLKLCCPKHYLCSSKVQLPPVVLTFSESVVNHIKEESHLYVNSVLAMALEQQKTAEQLRQKQEEEKQTLSHLSRMRRSETLAKIQESIEEANRALEEKKQKQMSDLKAQIEEKIIAKQLEKEKMIAEDYKLMLQIEEQNQRELEIKKDIEAEYKKRYLELQCMEQQAKSLCDDIKSGSLMVKNLPESSVKLFSQNIESQIASSSHMSEMNTLVTHYEVGENLKEHNTTNAPLPELTQNIVSSQQRSSVSHTTCLEETTVPLISSMPKNVVRLDEPSSKDLMLGEVFSHISSPLSALASSENQKQLEVPLLTPKKRSSSVNALNMLISQPYSFQTDGLCGDCEDSEKMPKAADDVFMSPSGILFCSNSRTFLKPRKINVHGHASDSTVQQLMYCSEVAGSDFVPNFFSKQSLPMPRQANVHGHSSDSTVQQLMYGGEEHSVVIETDELQNTKFACSLISNISSKQQSLPIPRQANVHGHSSDSTVQQLMYGNGEHYAMKETDELQNTEFSCSALVPNISSNQQSLPIPRKVNVHGHSSDSTVQQLMYGSEEHPTTIKVDESQSTDLVQNFSSKQQGLPRPKKVNVHGHAMDSTVQELMYNTLSNAKASLSSVMNLEIDPKVNEGNHFPPLGKGKQFTESEDQSNAIKAGDFQDIVINSDFVPSLSFKEQNLPKLGMIESSVPDETELPVNHVSSNKESELPSEETLNAQLHDNVSNTVLKYRGRNVHGHASDSTVQQLIYGKKCEEEAQLGGEDSKMVEKLDEIIQQNIAVLTSTYTPTYRKDYSILDEPPLPGLLTHLPQNTSDFSFRDGEDDISICQCVPLPVLLNRSLFPVVQAQIRLVNKSIIDYFLVDLHINDHFTALRNFFFFNDGEFGQSLSQLLFDKVSQCPYPSDLLNPVTLNSILSQALSMSLQGDSVYADCLSFSVKSIPLAFPSTAPNVLKCLDMCYTVGWPCNIVITEKNIVYYNSVLELLLQVKRSLWSLTDVWFHLKRNAKYHRLEMSPQYRQLQIYRHEMLHFARVMQSYIASQVLQVTWQEFQNTLLTKVHSLDDLRNAHTSYLKKACYRCLLSKKAGPVMKIINDVFTAILKFRLQLVRCPWKMNDSTGHLEHPAFQSLASVHKSFNEHSCFLYKVLNQLVTKGYQPHLKEFIVMLDFNRFYQTTSRSSNDSIEISSS